MILPHYLALATCVLTIPSFAQCPQDDAAEPNDDCASALPAALGTTGGLTVTDASEDWWTFTVPAGQELYVDVFFLHAAGDIDLELFNSAGTCGTRVDRSTSFTDEESVFYPNNSASPVVVTMRVELFAGSGTCNDYQIDAGVAPTVCSTTPDDAFEENDDCPSAASLSAGTYNGLYVRRDEIDEDWYSVSLNDGATLTADVLFNDVLGDIDARLFDACGGTQIDLSAGTGNAEQLSWTNNSGAPMDVFLEVYLWPLSPRFCNTYELVIDVQGGMPPNPIQAYCFGDGSAVACPCNNNSSPGHGGGCAHAGGDGAVLYGSGNPSAANDTLHFDLVGASANSFGLLVSGANALPQMGCVGCGIPAFDGLRCAGGDFRRHGTRSTNAGGDTSAGWGAPAGPAGGLIAANAFTVGQTRHFFVLFRTDLMTGCQTGQNSSNGVQVPILP